ncbi:MAG: hypothetical protein AB7I27_09915 [Bacteriovoracaceae bacterium]
MNIKSIIFTALLSLSFSAFAQWFPGQANLSIYPGQISVQVYNPYPYPIVCSGTVFGVTYRGVTLNAMFAETVLPVGRFSYANLYTNPYDPFMNGWANISCRYW